MATARPHSPQFACGGPICTDVRGEGETAMCAERDNRTMGPRRSTCGCGYGSELTRDPRATRRGGGDHEQIQKRVWGAQHQRSTIRPQAAQAASPLLPRRHVRYDRICKGGREGDMSLIRFLLLCFLINNNHHHRRKPLTSRSRDTRTNFFLFRQFELREQRQWCSVSDIQ